MICGKNRHADFGSEKVNLDSGMFGTFGNKTNENEVQCYVTFIIRVNPIAVVEISALIAENLNARNQSSFYCEQKMTLLPTRPTNH